MKTDKLKERLRRFWDGHQPYWESLASETSTLSPHRQKPFRFIPDGAKVLEVGCGNGANGRWLSERTQYVGIDISITALRQAICRPVALICGDAENLPFRDEAFDVVIATYTLEHLVNPKLGLQEMYRVSRPGGRIVLLGPSWDFPWWFPNSLRSRASRKWWRLIYTIRRFVGQMRGWLIGQLPFLVIDNPDVFTTGYTYDDEDAVYVVWTYEVIEFLCQMGCRLCHWEVDDRLLGTHPAVRLLKTLLLRLPPYRYAGSTLLLVFEKR